MLSPQNQPFQKRWLMFLLRPADLIQLLEIVSNPTNQFASGALPPDIRVEDVFYDEGENYLGIMLESEFFEAVEVRMNGALMQASWPRAVFALDDAADDLSDDELQQQELWGEPVLNSQVPTQAPFKSFVEELQDAATRDFRLRALTFAASDLLSILRSNSSRSLPVFPSYPPETRVIGAVAAERIASWTLFLEHDSFESCKVGQEGDLVHVEIPGENEQMFRIGLPGATLKRRLDLDFD
ncbi:hypothetical protein [Abditibacterium utsteinense]|nr:hypothetical protein [Abditibacterium utsteinense]